MICVENNFNPPPPPKFSGQIRASDETRNFELAQGAASLKGGGMPSASGFRVMVPIAQP
jgi:hypothetical protein